MKRGTERTRFACKTKLFKAIYTAPVRNPVWERDELILALDLYMKSGRQNLSASSKGIAELSDLLRSLPLHPEELRGRTSATLPVCP